MLTAGIAVVGGIVPRAVGASTQAAGGRATSPDLVGKTVVVHTRIHPVSMPSILGDCRFESQAGRLFLVGVRQPCSPHTPSWTDGILCCIAWECVEEYLVFGSLADYYGRLNVQADEELDEDSDATKST